MSASTAVQAAAAGTFWTVRGGDNLDLLRAMPEQSVQTCITSPPYWGLRDYDHDAQLGREDTPDQFVANLVAVFAEVRRVLRDTGSVWLNIGDSYASKKVAGLKPKDLCGMPWRVALALQADGWYIRSEIIWAKPNPMPESVRDRPTKAHEQVFLLTKAPRYFYNADAIQENAVATNFHDATGPGRSGVPGQSDHTGSRGAETGSEHQFKRNKRTVWTVAPQPFKGAHFAVFPEKLIAPMILAGSAPGDTILDPFSGSGTTGVVALRHDRNYIGLELNPEYAALSRNRIRDDAPLRNTRREANRT